MVSRLKILKPADQMDLWLDSQGYYRKHTARDASCLFRTVSEQLFLTQVFHTEVRRQCIELGLIYKNSFQKRMRSEIKESLERLKSPSEGGGSIEIMIMSLMYRCDFILFREIGKPAQFETNNGYDKKITLCLSQEKHYDSVYTKEHITNAAFCQSLIYEKLYKTVFGLEEVDYAVKKMLCDKSSRYQRDQSCYMPNGIALRLEMRDNCVNVKELLTLGVTPFPYKVAKSLNTEIYRNVEFDTWNEYRKGLRYAGRIWNNHELRPGGKCLVKLDEDKVYHAFIQEMEPNKGPVLVFIEEIGEKLTVPYDFLELMPQTPQPQVIPYNPLVHLRQLQKSSPPSSSVQPDSSQQHSLAKKSLKANNKMRNKDSERGEPCKRKPSVHVDSSSQMMMSVPVVSSSDTYQQNDYQSSAFECYQNQNYITQSCEVTSTVSEIEEGMKLDTFHQNEVDEAQQSSSNAVHDVNNNLATTVPVFNNVTVVPNKSILVDGSDLPLTDVSMLRYFYNLGLDYYVRLNCVIRPSPPSTCYPVIQATVPQYLPDHQHISFINLANEQHYPQPLKSSQQVTSDGMAVPVLQPVVEQNPSPSVNSESESSSNTSGVHQHQIAPRFKNRRKSMTNKYNKITNSNLNNDASHGGTNHNQHASNSEHQTGANKLAGMPILQHPEISTTHSAPMTQVTAFSPVITPSPLPPMTVPPPIAPLPPSVAHSIPSQQPSNHYIPVQPSYSPPVTAPTYYFQPVECDTYCPVAMNSYYEYGGVFDHTTSVYPTLVVQPSQPTQFPPTSYVTPDGNVYY